MPLLRLALPLVLVYVLRNGLDTTDPDNIVLMRAFFVACKLLVFGALAYVWTQVKNSDNMRMIKVSPSDLQPPNPLAKVLQPELQPGLPETMSVPEYDSKVLGKKLTQLAMQCSIVGFLHYYNGLTIPLVLSSVMGLWSLPSDPLIQIYIRGRSPADPEYAKELKRPFKQQSPFGDMMRPWQDMQERQKLQEEKRALRAQKKARKLATGKKR